MSKDSGIIHVEKIQLKEKDFNPGRLIILTMNINPGEWYKKSCYEAIYYGPSAVYSDKTVWSN